ncbi:MAG: FecR domain-containing protein [Spirochaetes bacterium]|nr:FecR domain-containing protein [Spirochaetota bacterium]
MKVLKICVVMLVAASMAFISCSQKDEELNVSENILKAKVTLVKGSAYILREDDPAKIRVKIGKRILPNDVIITGKNSAVNIVIADRGLFKIKQNSNVSLKDLIRVDGDNNKARIKVTAGKIVLGLQKLKRGSSFEVETPTAVAGVRGTSFMVSVNQKDTSAFPYFVKLKKKEEVVTKIAVLTGKVELINPKNNSQKLMISSLKEATLNNDDFRNIKVERITRISLDEISSIKDYSEIKELKLREISEEIKKAEPRIEDVMKSDLKTKAEVKSGKEDLSKTEEAIEKQKIEAKKEAIKKLKSSTKKSEGKYLDDESGW